MGTGAVTWHGNDGLATERPTLRSPLQLPHHQRLREETRKKDAEHSNAIDFNTGRVTIQRTLQWHSKKQGGGPYFEDTKTKSGRRSIPIAAGTLQQLREHRALALRNIAKKCEPQFEARSPESSSALPDEPSVMFVCESQR